MKGSQGRKEGKEGGRNEGRKEEGRMKGRMKGRKARSRGRKFSKAEKIKNLVIVGAGPAGLEAARIAAERGHKVTVLEASPKEGGQLRLAAQTPRRKELMSIIDWRMHQCLKHHVSFEFNCC